MNSLIPPAFAMVNVFPGIIRESELPKKQIPLPQDGIGMTDIYWRVATHQ
jgi:hypothetical protein